MELTYESMMEYTERYFDILPSIDPKKDPKIVDKVRDFFSSDFMIRWGEPPKFHNREQWMDHLCGHADEYKAIVLYKPDPLHIIIDDRKKIAACLVQEEMRHSVTGKPLKIFLINVRFEFTLENKAIKFKKELISYVSSPFQLESLPK